MANLVGSVADYEGADDDMAFVSVDAIAANCTQFDTAVPGILRNIVGDACPGYFSTARAVFDRAQEVAQILNGLPLTVDPCIWLDYFAPLVFRGSLSIVEFDPVQHIAYWRLAAQQFRITGTTILPTGEIICYYGVWDKKEWLYKGVKPTIEDAGHDEILCGDPHFDKFMSDPLYSISAPGGGNLFRKGSCSMVFLSDATDYDNPALQYTPGGPFMPIPPIPDGFPALPVVPPLQGGAIVEALSDEDCAAIVERGGGFRTLSDIADYSDGASWEEFDDYTVRMLVPNERNLNYARYVLTLIDVEFWASVIPAQTIDGNPLTLGAVLQAFNAASDATKSDWLRHNVGTVNLLQLWDALALGGNETLVRETSKIFLKEVADAPLMVPSVVLSETAAVSTLEASLGPAGEILLVLTLAEQQMKNKIVYTTVDTNECNGPATWHIVSEVAEDAAGLFQYNELPWKKWLTETLQELRRCCNPCSEVPTDITEFEGFWGYHTPEAEAQGGEPKRIGERDYSDANRVVFSVIHCLLPKKYEFGQPDLGLFAKVAFINKYDDTGPIHYVNIDQQTLFVDIEDVKGLMVHCYPGVSLQVHKVVRTSTNPPKAYYNGAIDPTLAPP